MESVNEENRVAASNKLSDTIADYISRQDKFNKKLNMLTLIGLSILVLSIIGASYLIFKPAPATLMDLNHVKEENNALATRRKLLQYDEEAFRKEKELFVILKSKTDSDLHSRRQDIVKMMANIYKQDSFSKLKNVIKTDHINTNTINTVNTKNVNVKK